MAWDLVVAFIGSVKDARKVAESIVKGLKKQIRIYLKDIVWEQIALEDNKEECALLFKIELTRFQESLEDSMEDLANAVYERLAMTMVNHGFIPVNEDGNIIYILEPYGFSALYAIREDGQGKKLEELVAKAAEEFPGEAKTEIFLSFSKQGLGEMYQVNVYLNDYNPDSLRQRLMLAMFFRITILASNSGFFPVEPDE